MSEILQLTLTLTLSESNHDVLLKKSQGGSLDSNNWTVHLVERENVNHVKIILPSEIKLPRVNAVQSVEAKLEGGTVPTHQHPA